MEDYIVIDIETTGTSPEIHKITEIGAVKVIKGEVVDTYDQLINPETVIPESIIRLTGIDDSMVKNMPVVQDVLPQLFDFCQEYPILGHNVMFDFSFIKYNAIKHKLRFEKNGVDTLYIARKFLKQLESRSLSFLIQYFEIQRENAHRAFDDALATQKLYELLKENFYEETTKKHFIAKPLHYKVKKKMPITDRQARYLSHLVAKYHLTLEKEIKQLSKNEASRAIDHIIHQYGA